MKNNYFFVDGACLLKDIEMFKKSDSSLRDKRMNLDYFMNFFTHNYSPMLKLHAGYTRRFSFYFVKGSKDRFERNVETSDRKIPGNVMDWDIQWCGENVIDSKKLTKWVIDNNPPQFVSDAMTKTEKAVDTQICCDALQLAALDKIDRLFIYTNDSDFLPLLKTLKRFGVNVSLISLSNQRHNDKLCDEADSYNVIIDTPAYQKEYLFK